MEEAKTKGGSPRVRFDSEEEEEEDEDVTSPIESPTSSATTTRRSQSRTFPVFLGTPLKKKKIKKKKKNESDADLLSTRSSADEAFCKAQEESLLLTSTDPAAETLRKVVDKAAYTRCYCEENVWHLASKLLSKSKDWQSYAVFATNRQQRCPVWYQKSARDDDAPCLWDYHVFFYAVSRKANLSAIVDLDTTLETISDAASYVKKALVPALKLPPDFHPILRVESAESFVQNFSSDRSHMRNSRGEYSADPPKTHAICSHPSNLKTYLETSPIFPSDLASPDFVQTVNENADSDFGVLLDLPTFYAWIDLGHPGNTAGVHDPATAAAKILDHHNQELRRRELRRSLDDNIKTAEKHDEQEPYCT